MIIDERGNAPDTYKVRYLEQNMNDEKTRRRDMTTSICFFFVVHTITGMYCRSLSGHFSNCNVQTQRKMRK